MNSKNLVIKDLVIGGLIAILSFPLPYIDKLNEINNYLFLTAFVVMVAANLIPKNFSLKQKKHLLGVAFPFFKLGIVFTAVSLLTVPLGATDTVKFLIIFIAFTALIISLVLERQEPNIFIDGAVKRHNMRLKILTLLISVTIVLAGIHWFTSSNVVLMLAYASFFLSFFGLILMVIWFIYRIFKMY